MMMMMIVMMMMVMMISPFVSSVGKQSYSHFVPQELPRTTVFCQHCHAFYRDNYYDDNYDKIHIDDDVHEDGQNDEGFLFLQTDIPSVCLHCVVILIGKEKKLSLGSIYILLQYPFIRHRTVPHTHPLCEYACYMLT